jgi:hypothetical protein
MPPEVVEESVVSVAVAVSVVSVAVAVAVSVVSVAVSVVSVAVAVVSVAVPLSPLAMSIGTPVLLVASEPVPESALVMVWKASVPSSASPQPVKVRAKGARKSAKTLERMMEEA